VFTTGEKDHTYNSIFNAKGEKKYRNEKADLISYRRYYFFNNCCRSPNNTVGRIKMSCSSQLRGQQEISDL
jgi:hypothetical protein